MEGLIIVFLALTGRWELVFSLGSTHWLWIFLTSLLLFGYVTSWYSGLKHLRVSMATSILTLGSMITAFFSVFSGTFLDMRETTGMILLLLGLILLLLFKKVVGLFKSTLRLLYAWS